VRKPEGKIPPRRQICRLVDNIKIDFVETGWWYGLDIWLKIGTSEGFV
jgi:hypothetical protein